LRPLSVRLEWRARAQGASAEGLTNWLLARLSSTSALYQMFGVLGDVLVVSNDEPAGGGVASAEGEAAIGSAVTAPPFAWLSVPLRRFVR
jgi:hypothetical protein